MYVYRMLGMIFVGAAILGLFLPLLPTTPLVLLAAACFARSSEKWHRWMLANDTFGPMIRNWERHRCINRRAKLIALFSMLLVGGYSIFVVIQPMWLKLSGALLIITGLIVIGRIRTCSKR